MIFIIYKTFIFLTSSEGIIFKANAVRHSWHISEDKHHALTHHGALSPDKTIVDNVALNIQKTLDLLCNSQYQNSFSCRFETKFEDKHSACHCFYVKHNKKQNNLLLHFSFVTTKKTTGGILLQDDNIYRNIYINDDIFQESPPISSCVI